MIDGNAWTLLVVLFGFLVCCLAASIGKSKLLRKELDDMRNSAMQARYTAHNLRTERDLLMAMQGARCSHWERIKDERIESLEAENRALREVIEEVME